MTTQSITSATKGQKKQYLRFVEDAAERAFNEIGLDKDNIQTLIGRGDEFQARIVAGIRELSLSNQFADEEVESTYGYLSGYRKPAAMAEQIDILRSHWPSLNPDAALRYMRKVYGGLDLPKWVEGPFAIIRPGFFSDQYGEELAEVLKALAKSLNGQFQNYREGQLGPQYLRQSERTAAKLRALIEQQPGSDILILPAQFGFRHRGRSVRRARKVFAGTEAGVGAKDGNTMLLTHPIRLKNPDDLWIDWAGDEFSPDGDGSFGGAPYSDFRDGRVEFGVYSSQLNAPGVSLGMECIPESS